MNLSEMSVFFLLKPQFLIMVILQGVLGFGQEPTNFFCIYQQ